MTNWNIWNIKSKALRAIVAWLFAGLAAVVVLAALPFAVVWLAVAGVVGAAVGAWQSVDHRGWVDILSHWWRAATGKEAA